MFSAFRSSKDVAVAQFLSPSLCTRHSRRGKEETAPFFLSFLSEHFEISMVDTYFILDEVFSRVCFGIYFSRKHKNFCPCVLERT